MSRGIPPVRSWRVTFRKGNRVIAQTTVLAPTLVLVRLNLIFGEPNYWRWLGQCDKLTIFCERRRCDYCGEQDAGGETTWQQWQCCACSSWNERRPK